MLFTWAILALAVACGGGGANAAANDGPLLVLAAADLQAALPEVAERYTTTTGQATNLVFGSTGQLAAQIEHGAPADLFLAANESFIDRLAARDLIVPETRRVYAIGPLVIVSAPGVPLPDDASGLADAAYSTIAIANPEHAPYGEAAREALRSAGILDAVRPRLVFAENIAQALQFVRTGNAEAGIVALGLVLRLPGIEHRKLDPSLHAPLRQSAAVLRDSPRQAEAAAFLELLTGPDGREILTRHGFEPPEGR